MSPCIRPFVAPPPAFDYLFCRSNFSSNDIREHQQLQGDSGPVAGPFGRAAKLELSMIGPLSSA